MSNALIEEAVRAAFVANPDKPVMAILSATQAVLESGLASGRPSQLATRANNFHGIKGVGPAGSINMPTMEAWGRVNADFRKYNTAEEGFAGHKAFLERNRRYKAVLQAETPEEAFRRVKAAGYATDVDYVAKLENAYNQHIKPILDKNPEIAFGLSLPEKVLGSSPQHMQMELEALAASNKEGAKEHLAKLQQAGLSEKDAKRAKAEAVRFIVRHAKEVLDAHHIPADSTSYSLAERLGPQTAMKLLAIENKSGTKMKELVEKGVITGPMLKAYLDTFSERDREAAGVPKDAFGKPEEMSLEHFGQLLTASQKRQKEEAYEKHAGSLSEPNRNLLQQMMDANMGIGQFLVMLVALLVGSALGVDMSKFLSVDGPGNQSPGGSVRQSGAGRDTRYSAAPGANPEDAARVQQNWEALKKNWDGTEVIHTLPMRGDVKMTSNFGPRNTGIPGASAYHRAHDYVPANGTAPVIVASAKGVVEFADTKGGYGWMVRIRHADGTSTHYAHLAEAPSGADGRPLRPGDTVERGAKVGMMGSTGVGSGAHLDYKLYGRDGHAIVPRYAGYGETNGKGSVLSAERVNRGLAEIEDGLKKRREAEAKAKAEAGKKAEAPAPSEAAVKPQASLGQPGYAEISEAVRKQVFAANLEGEIKTSEKMGEQDSIASASADLRESGVSVAKDGAARNMPKVAQAAHKGTQAATARV